MPGEQGGMGPPGPEHPIPHQRLKHGRIGPLLPPSPALGVALLQLGGQEESLVLSHSGALLGLTRAGWDPGGLPVSPWASPSPSGQDEPQVLSCPSPNRQGARGEGDMTGWDPLRWVHLQTLNNGCVWAGSGPIQPWGGALPSSVTAETVLGCCHSWGGGQNG